MESKPRRGHGDCLGSVCTVRRRLRQPSLFIINVLERAVLLNLWLKVVFLSLYIWFKSAMPSASEHLFYPFSGCPSLYAFRIPIKNCIRSHLKSFLKSSVISGTANLPGCQGACLEDPFIHWINKHLLNVYSEPGSRRSAEVLFLQLSDLTVQWGGHIGDLTVTTCCRECCPIGECWCCGREGWCSLSVREGIWEEVTELSPRGLGTVGQKFQAFWAHEQK